MSPIQNTHKYTRTSLDGNTHYQIDHILIDRSWHSIVLDVVSVELTVILVTVLWLQELGKDLP